MADVLASASPLIAVGCGNGGSDRGCGVEEEGDVERMVVVQEACAAWLVMWVWVQVAVSGMDVQERCLVATLIHATLRVLGGWGLC